MADTRLTGLVRQLHTGLVPGLAPGQTDRDALRAFVTRRDETAFAALVQRHGSMVLRVCQRVLHHAQDAEDAFQATFLVLARKADSIGRSESLPGWLHGVAFRIALRARRDAGRRRAREREAPVAARADPAEDLAWRDVQVLLEAEIRRLPEPYRAVFVLCHLEGRSRADVAAELGIQENTVSSRLARARDRLRDRLGRRGVHLPALLAAVALSTGETGQALPTNLLNTTAQAAVQFAARQPTGLSTFALQLTSGMMKSMAIARLKWAAGILAVGGTLAIGTWGMGQGQGPTPGTGGGSPPKAASREDKPFAAERTADYVQRQRSLKNLKRILVAMHAFHDATGRFPADVTDKAGKPVLSWRVELLPYLEESHLYKEINRDEPWDSEHNLGLLARMPDVFRVGFEPKGATHTYYQRFAIAGFAGNGGAGEGGTGAGPPGAGGPAGPGVPAGPGASPPGGLIGPGGAGPMGGIGGFPGEPPTGSLPAGPGFPSRMAEITDGTSNTLGVIEAGPPVPWTKPADFVYDRSKPLPAMTGPFANVRNAATLDGAAHSLRPNLEQSILRRLIDPNDGQVLPELKTLRARFPADTEDEKKVLARLFAENQALIDEIQKLTAENAALIGLSNRLTRDVDRAEETQDWLQRTLEELKAVNQKYRGMLGLSRNQSLPPALRKEP